MEEISKGLAVVIQNADRGFAGSDNAAGRVAKLGQHLSRIIFGSQFLSQIDQHIEPGEIRVLELAVFFFEQCRLLLDLLVLLEEFDKDGHLRSENFGIDRLDDVIYRAQRIAAAEMTDTGAVRRQKDNRNVARFFPAANQFSCLQTIDARHVDIQQHHRHVVIEEITQRIFARGRADQNSVRRLQDRLERQQIGGAVVDH